MKQIFFGIALILFALVLLLSEIWLPIVGDLMSRGEFAVLIAVIGLVIAGLGAEGITVVDDIYYIERGYEAFDQKLSLLGALIEKVSDEKEIQKFTLKVS